MKKKEKEIRKKKMAKLYPLKASEYEYHIYKKDKVVEDHKEIADIKLLRDLEIIVERSKNQLRIHINNWKKSNPDLIIDEEGKIVEYYSHF